MADKKKWIPPWIKNAEQGGKPKGKLNDKAKKKGGFPFKKKNKK